LGGGDVRFSLCGIDSKPQLRSTAGMTKQYRPWTPFQSYLLPPAPVDWLPKEHLVYFVVEVLGELDLRAIEAALQAKDARGERPYDPHMMVALLVYAYSVGVYSSRRIERATHEDVAFRVLTGNAHPHFTTINEFRRQFRRELATLFAGVLNLCDRAGMVKLGHVAIDGTKVKANASKHKAMSYDRMNETEKRLLAEVQALLERADAVDEEEDRLYGAGRREWELPEELQHRETRLKRIREAKAALEAEAKERRAADLREQAAGMRESAEAETRPSMQKRLRSRAKKCEEKAGELFPRGDDDDDSAGPAPTELPRHRIEATPEAKPPGRAQRNFTDPESCLMAAGGGFIQGWNAQVAVDEEHQVIVACGVTNQPPDSGNLVPMVARVVDACGRAPAVVTADTGYWTPGAPEACRALGSEALIALERTKHGQSGKPTARGAPPPDASAREQMRHKLNTPEGRALYARRKSTAEPVFGQIKGPRGFREFSFRGQTPVDDEWSLVCACHNLLKLFRFCTRALVPA